MIRTAWERAVATADSSLDIDVTCNTATGSDARALKTSLDYFEPILSVC